MGQVLNLPIESQLLQRRGNSNYKVGTAEMQGRRMQMEDTHIVVTSLSSRHPDVGLFGIFDGHSGSAAAQFLLRELAPRIAALDDPTDDAQLSRCVQQLDWDFLKNPEDRMDGSTCTFCITHPHKASRGLYVVIAVNVGDSRSMLVNPDGTIKSLTADHKPTNLAEITRIQTAGGNVSLGRVDGQLAMSRAVGDWQYKHNPSLPLEEQKVVATPDITRSIAKPGDVLLLLCDGLVEQMTSEEAGKYVREFLDSQGSKSEQDLAYVCYDLNRFSLSRQSKDNHSVLLVSFEDGTEYERPDEFIPGAPPTELDSKFAELYFADARKHGWEGEDLAKLISRSEILPFKQFESIGDIFKFTPPVSPDRKTTPPIGKPPTGEYLATPLSSFPTSPQVVPLDSISTPTSSFSPLQKFTFSTSCSATSVQSATSTSPAVPPSVLPTSFSLSSSTSSTRVPFLISGPVNSAPSEGPPATARLSSNPEEPTSSVSSHADPAPMISPPSETSISSSCLSPPDASPIPPSPSSLPLPDDSPIPPPVSDSSALFTSADEASCALLSHSLGSSPSGSKHSLGPPEATDVLPTTSPSSMTRALNFLRRLSVEKQGQKSAESA